MSLYTRSRLKEKVAPFAIKMAAVSDVRRLAIIFLLSYGEKSAQELLEAIKLSAPLLWHHIRLLVQSKWITREKRGREVYFSLNSQAFFELHHLLKDTPQGRSWENSKVKQWYR